MSGSELSFLPDDSVFLHLDEAWEPGTLNLETVDAREWGPKLRCFAPPATAERFYEEIVAALPPFVLSGSGDFHHLSALFLRKIKTPITVVSFDNHPDWDIRPPRWACGGWLTRALEMPNVTRASIWGCGNFELAWPHRLFANRALGTGRLQVHAWKERQPPAVQKRFDCMSRDDWRDRFSRFAKSIAGTDVYVTVDIDALSEQEVVTNWEEGLFTAAEVAWAIGELRTRGKVIAGDICGAWSSPVYARWKQKFAAEWDRPKKPRMDSARARAVNLRAVGMIWPALMSAEC